MQKFLKSEVKKMRSEMRNENNLQILREASFASLSSLIKIEMLLNGLKFRRP
jgi:hypothetical protein